MIPIHEYLYLNCGTFIKLIVYGRGTIYIEGLLILSICLYVKVYMYIL